MKRLRFLLEKEFRQIFRNPVILRLIMIMPVVQLIVIPYAADFEVKNISLTVVDQDGSEYSRALVQKIEASGFFTLEAQATSYEAALNDLEAGIANLVLQIPVDFERAFVREGQASLYLAADAVDGVKAGLGAGYLQQIILAYNQELRLEWMDGLAGGSLQLEVRVSNWYNPTFNYHLFMVPGILAILVTMVGAFLTALNIVSEKEAGTIEQLNVTPIQKWEFILGKLIPFWILGLVSITLGMIVAWVFFGLWPEGSIGTIYLFSAVYLLSVLGIGLIVSVVSDTQQQAILFAFFFMMVFVLMGGLFTPVESMPVWAQWIAYLNPPTYFIESLRAIYLKGSQLTDLVPNLVKIVLFAVVFNGIAVLGYRKRVA